MFRKKFVLMGCAMAVVTLCLAVSGMLHPALANALEEIKARGKIIVAIDPTFAPFEFTDASGKIVGYDPDILEAIAADWGVAIEYQVMAFPSIIPSIIAGSVDMAGSALNPSAERAKKIDFTIPFASSVVVVMKLKENTSVKSSRIDDLSGLTCTVKQVTHPEKMMKAQNKELKAKGAQTVKLMSLDTVEQTIAALVAKRVDCLVDTKVVLVETMAAHPDLPIEIVGEIGGRTFITWGLNKNKPELTNALNEAIRKLKSDGTLSELQMKYFGYAMDDLPESGYIKAD
jgi:polar amino acid transport system substrate-binding protein